METLSSLGYQVIVTTDGEQALREIEGRPNSIHLVLLDVMLPKLSGPEVYARLNGARPSLPVIFTTGYSADLGSLGKIRQQGLPVLQKPYTRNSLARKVRETLDERVRTR